MLKFILGVVFGAVMSILYVNYNVRLPAFMHVPDMLRGNLVATATEATLYDLDAPEAARQRAVEVYFSNRASDAAKIDTAYGHPFLTTLHKERVAQHAQRLMLAWNGFDMALSQEHLRQRLETKHGTTDRDALKLALLLETLERKPFLKRWLEKTGGPVTAENVLARVKAVSAYPTVLQAPDT